MNKTLRAVFLFLLILACLAATVLMAILGTSMYRHFTAIPDYRGGVISSYMPISGRYLCLSGYENFKFNIEEKKFYPVCNPEECGENCPLGNYMQLSYYPYTLITAADKDRIYFHYIENVENNNNVEKSYKFAYADTKTGKITVIASLSHYASRYSYPYAKNFLYEDFLYCSFQKRIESEMSDTQKEYVNAVFRIPKDGGDFELLFECKEEDLQMVADGKILTTHGGDELICYDINSGERTTVLTTKDISTSFQYYDGKVYFLTQVSSINSDYSLIALDLKTKSTEILVDSASYFCLAPDGKGIYYVTGLSTLKFCDINGENVAELYSGEHYFSSFTVIEGKLYGNFTMYDEETQAYFGGDRLIIFDPKTKTYESYKYPTFHEYD